MSNVPANWERCWLLQQDLAVTTGPHQKQAREIYTKLRTNLVENVFREWEKTGFAWEQYNPETGDGQRTQHFTG